MWSEVRTRGGWALCFMIILGSSCSGNVLKLTNNSDEKPATADVSLSYLDAGKPTLVQPINATDKAANADFVQVEVVEVQNPKRYAATFRVDYQTKTNEKIFLGTFSLYPSDGPGKFIVPTRGQLKDEGAIVLSLLIPDDFKSGDVLRAGVRKIRFVKK